MTQEISDIFKPESLHLDRMLASESMFLALLTGKEDERERIVRDSVSPISTDPALQQIFLRSIISVLSKEGESDETDRRDAVLEILKTSSAVDLLSQNGTIVFDIYLQALGSQTKENDPFSGSINSLLEAGVFFSPYFPQDDLARRQLEHGINQTAQHFSSRDERDHIQSFSNEILERMTLQGSRDARVEYWRLKQLKNREIATKLGVNEGTIEQSVARLIDEGKLESRRGAKRAIDDEVATLRNQGLSNREIVLRLHEKMGTIEASVRRLLDLGMIEEREFIPGGRKQSEGSKKFDEQVERLVKQGLKRRMIVKETGEHIRKINSSLSRLKAAGRIESEKKKQKKISPKEKISVDAPETEKDTVTVDVFANKVSDVEVRNQTSTQPEVLEKKEPVRTEEPAGEPAPPKDKIQKFDAEIKALKAIGFQTKEIIDMFRIEPWKVLKSVKRLEKSGMIDVSDPRQIEKLITLDKKVKSLMAQGFDGDAIAQKVSETVDEVQKSMLRIRMRGKKKQ